MATTTTLARPARTSHRALIWLAALFGLALVLGGAWQLADLAARHTTVVRNAYAGVRAVSISADSGDIQLTSAPAGARLTVEEHVTRGLAAPRRQNGLVAGRLRLRSECRSWFASQCEVRYVVAVPRGTSVVADSGSGDVNAASVTSRAPMHLSTGSGEVRVRGVSTPELRLDSGSGGIGGTAVHVRVLRARTGSGSIGLELRDPPRELLADTGSGDVALTLPDRPYALTTSTGSGHIIDDGVHQDTRSPRRVVARSGSGDLVLDIARG